MKIGRPITGWPQTIKKARNRRNSGWEPEFLLPALSAAANSVIYVCVNSLICSLDALACRLFEGLQTIDFVDALRLRTLAYPEPPCVYWEMIMKKLTSM